MTTNTTWGTILRMRYTPPWATFVKAFQNPQRNKKVHFTRVQEAVRKDVERAFGVLQSRFAMVQGPARWWSKEDLWFIMQTCIILHNMIIEDERDEEDDFNYHQEGTRELTPEDYQNHDPLVLEEFLRIHKVIEDKSSHEQLSNDLVEHLWAIHSST
jgi:antirestriction protein